MLAQESLLEVRRQTEGDLLLLLLLACLHTAPQMLAESLDCTSGGMECKR